MYRFIDRLVPGQIPEDTSGPKIEREVLVDDNAFLRPTAVNIPKKKAVKVLTHANVGDKFPDSAVGAMLFEDGSISFGKKGLSPHLQKIVIMMKMMIHQKRMTFT